MHNVVYYLNAVAVHIDPIAVMEAVFMCTIDAPVPLCASVRPGTKQIAAYRHPVLMDVLAGGRDEGGTIGL
jgi:hypothetical protein